jgi:hypothetical protein
LGIEGVMERYRARGMPRTGPAETRTIRDAGKMLPTAPARSRGGRWPGTVRREALKRKRRRRVANSGFRHARLKRVIIRSGLHGMRCADIHKLASIVSKLYPPVQ